MNKQIENSKTFAQKFKIYKGEWELSYTDVNYIPDDNFIPIGKIIFDNITIKISEEYYENISNAFTLNVYDQNKIIKCLKRQCVNSNNFDQKTENFVPTLYNELSKSLTRVGILTPEIDIKILEEIQQESILTLVHDTNAIVNGTTNFLLYELGNKNLLNIITKFIQLEIQEKSSSVKKQKKTEIKNCKDVDKRAFSTNALRVINQIKNKYPLEYLGNSSELFISRRQNDKRNVLYDRMIIETIKHIYGLRNTNSKVILVTSDFDLARFAKIENVDVFFSKFKKLNSDGESLYSVRFSQINNQLHFCSIYDFIWDLTNMFGKIKLENKIDKKTFIFNYYGNSNKLENWENDELEVEFIFPQQILRKEISKFANEKNKSIKMVGLTKLLKVIEFLHQNKNINISTCKEEIKLAETTCKDYFHVLDGIGLIKRNQNIAYSTELVDIFINELNRNNIDNLVMIFRNYEPFDLFLNMMEKVKSIDKYKVNEEKTKSILEENGINDYKAMRVFPNMGIHLGVLFPVGDKIHWANEKPSYESFEKSFTNAYNKHKILEGYASIADIINEVCPDLNISLKVFNDLFNKFYQKKNQELRTGGSVLTESKNVIEILSHRSNGKRFNKHVLEDGIIIAGKAIKSIKFGASNE